MGHRTPGEQPSREQGYRRRVDAALAEGKLWRAKEILQGRLGQSPYDPALYGLYGSVLLRMGDLVEAGKYFFLSGERRPEQREAIELYLHRHARRDWPSLAATFPRAARHLAADAYPEAVRQDLRRLGLSAPDAVPATTAPEAFVIPRAPVMERLAVAGCVLLVLFTLVCALVGFAVVLRAVVEWLR